MTLNIKDSQVAEYEQLISELRKQAKHDQDTIIRLEEKVAELENLHAACDDVENEVSRLREDNKELQEYYDRVYMENVEKDRQVENWKHRYKLLMEEHEDVSKQNRTMRELIKQWA